MTLQTSLPWPQPLCLSHVKARGTLLQLHPRLNTSHSKTMTSYSESWPRGAATGSVCSLATPVTSPPSPRLLQERPVCLPRHRPPQPGPDPHLSPLPCLSPLLLPQPLPAHTTQLVSSPTHCLPCRWGCWPKRDSFVLCCRMTSSGTFTFLYLQLPHPFVFPLFSPGEVRWLIAGSFFWKLAQWHDESQPASVQQPQPHAGSLSGGQHSSKCLQQEWITFTSHWENLIHALSCPGDAQIPGPSFTSSYSRGWVTPIHWEDWKKSTPIF